MAVRRRHSTARALHMDFLQASGQRISDKTVCNRLHENGLHSRRPARGPILTREHRRARLDFAQDHEHWQLRHWHPILFTNESRFHVSTCDRGYGGGPVNDMPTSTSSDTTDTVVGP